MSDHREAHSHRPRRHRRSKITALLLPALVVVAATAAHAKVKVVTDDATDPSTLRTFDFQVDEERAKGSHAHVILPELEKLTQEILEQKGYVRDTESPDFLLTWDGMISDDLSVWGAYFTHLGYAGVWDTYTWYVGVPDATSHGVFVIRTQLPGEKEPFWMAGDHFEIGGTLRTDRLWKKLKKATGRILKPFPER